MTEKNLLRIFREEHVNLILSQTACRNRQRAEMDAASEFFSSEVSDLERYSKAYEYLATGTSSWHKAGRIYFERTARRNARRIFDQDRAEIATWYGNPVSPKVFFQQALRLRPENDSVAVRHPSESTF
jgi:hypothetical protein